MLHCASSRIIPPSIEIPRLVFRSTAVPHLKRSSGCTTVTINTVVYLGHMSALTPSRRVVSLTGSWTLQRRDQRQKPLHSKQRQSSFLKRIK